jgi:hypothetical protein
MRPSKRLFFALGLIASAAGTFAVCLDLAFGQQVHRNGFEGREAQWLKGPSDAVFRELSHRISEDSPHTGQRSETLKLECEQGNYIHYYYETGRAPMGEDLNVSVWLKANRPGVQLLARLVLPHQPDAKQAGQPMTTLLRGDTYDRAGRWQHLELRQPVKRASEQQQLLRAELNHDINLSDAYVDQIVLNLYCGPGTLEVFIDDLEIGPVVENVTRPTRPVEREAGPGRLTANRVASVTQKNEQLLVGNQRFFFRAIRHTDTPLKVLRNVGFNTLWLEDASPEVIQDAADQGFWIVPGLPVNADGCTGESAKVLAQNVSTYLQQESVLFWDLGRGGLAKEQADTVSQVAKLVREADPTRPLAADVWDGFLPYSRTVQLLGVHRWPLMTGLELIGYRDWLNQRRLLAEPGTFLWTWVQTHLPDWYTNLVYEKPGSQGFSDPIGPQPEQIRLLTYLALASGCRGLGFWSDRFLADSHQGRDRLLGMALLNQELQMLEPFLVTANPPIWVDTSSPDIKAAVLRCPERGVLVLPIWIGAGSQYVPGQAADPKLLIVVPEVPRGLRAWQVSPGDVHGVTTERQVGGTRVEIPEFGLTSAIVFTADNGDINGTVVRFQHQQDKMGKLAAQWSHALAEVELDKVSKVYAELEKGGHGLPDGQKLLDKARQYIQSCAGLWNDGDYPAAYNEAQRALRPLRILMRSCWELATRELDSPVASPYAVSFYSLPLHWRFMEQIKQATPSANLLPNGDFELASGDGWVPQEETLDEVDPIVRRVTEEPHEGKQCLKLEIQARKTLDRDGKPNPPPAALERTYLALHSPVVRLQPGSLVQISGWVRIPKAITASADGVLLYDSAGGEPLAVRLSGAVGKWKRFTLYRRVPATGTINVTLALTGLGTVYFDDIRIEPLNGGRASVSSSR